MSTYLLLIVKTTLTRIRERAVGVAVMRDLVVGSKDLLDWNFPAV